MREILFRGQWTINHQWKEGLLLIDDLENPNPYIVSNKAQYRVAHKTVGQYTGLTDKNGKKIFEGDIIRMHGNNNDLAVVEFGEFACVSIEPTEKVDTVIGWHYKPLATDALSKLEPFCWEFQINEMWIKENDIRVIGNIYDNPELLGVEKNG